MSDSLVIIRHFGDTFSAEAARMLLEAHDIPSLVMGDDAGGMQPALTYVRGVRLAVREEDAARALRLLDEDHSSGMDDVDVGEDASG